MKFLHWGWKFVSQIALVAMALLLLLALSGFVFTQFFRPSLYQSLPENIRHMSKLQSEESPFTIKNKSAYQITLQDGQKIFAMPFITRFQAERAIKSMALDKSKIKLRPNDDGFVIEGLFETPWHLHYSNGLLIASPTSDLSSIFSAPNTTDNSNEKQKTFADTIGFEVLQNQKILEGDQFQLWNNSQQSDPPQTLSQQWLRQFPFGGWSLTDQNGEGARIRFVGTSRQKIDLQYASGNGQPSIPSIFQFIPYNAPLAFVYRDLATEIAATNEFLSAWHPNLANIWQSALSGLLVEKSIPAEDLKALIKSFSGESALVILPDRNDSHFALAGMITESFKSENVIKIMKAATIKSSPKLVERKLEDGSVLQEFELTPLSEVPVETKKNQYFEHFKIGKLDLLVSETAYVLTNKFQYGEKMIRQKPEASMAMRDDVQDIVLRRFAPAGSYVVGKTKELNPLIAKIFQADESAFPPMLKALKNYPNIIMTQRFDGQHFFFDGVLSE